MRINQLSKAISAFAIGLALLACSKEFNYTPAEPEDASKTYVTVDMSAPRSLDIDGADINLTFVRNNASGPLEVGLVLNDESGIFKLESPTAKFADGEKTANAVVSYSYDALVPETIYNISVAVANADYTSQYMPSAFPVACKKAWQNLGMAQWYDDWWIGGPFEKQLLKSPDGSETYRLINPWDEAAVTAGGLTFESELPYLEFTIDEQGLISWGGDEGRIDLGFSFSGMTCHNLHPAKRNDADSVAANCMVLENVAQFCWYPILAYSNGSFRWWGVTSVAYISFPGGPDLATLLGL